MKNFILTALLLLCAFSIHSAEHGKNIPKSIANETTFNFTGMSNIDWSAVSSSAYHEELGYQGGIDIYIHTDRYEAPNLYVWDADGNKLNDAWPGTANGKFCYVAPSNNQDNKRTYYKFHFDNVTAVNFIVNFGGSDQTGDAHILEAGAYFFDYIDHVGWNYDHNEKNETHHTLKARNEYYTGGTDGSHTTVYVKSNTDNFIPATYWWNVNEPHEWNTDWVWDSHPANEITLNNERWYRFDFTLSEIYTLDYWDNATQSHIEKPGGVIISKRMVVDNQTCDIDWMRDGDYFFYYLPYGPYDKYEVAAMMNGRSHNFKEWIFDSKPYVGEDVKITLIDPNTLEFASLEQDGFTLTLSDPSGLSLSQCIKTINGVPMLRLNLNATLTLHQNDSHIINMVSFDGIYDNGGSIKHEQMLDESNPDLHRGQIGYFHRQNQPATVTKVIDKHGNNYDELGGYDKIYTCEEKEISFTFDNKNYALKNMSDGDYIAFKSITVRDANIESGIVDMYGAYRFFWWNITDPMVIIRYAPEEGVLYCHSVKDSETWVHPRPTQEQIDNKWVADDVDKFTNYDWLAIYLTDAQMAEFESQFSTNGALEENRFINHVIAPNTIQGYYCDFAIDAEGSAQPGQGNAPRRERTPDAVSSYEAVAYLNPTIKASRLPEVTEETVARKLNTYVPFNFNKQDRVFFLPPKRNEVCNINYTIPMDSRKELVGVRYFWPDNRDPQNPDSIYLQAVVWVHGENTPELFDKFHFTNTYEFCRDHNTALVHEGVVQMVFISENWDVQWEKHEETDANGNVNVFYQPQPDEGGAVTVPEIYNTHGDERYVEYYDIYVNRLAINPVLAAKREVNIWNSIEDIPVNSLKEIASIEYYNASGMMSKQPFNGFNIMVVRYTDGKTATKKIMKSN